MNERGSGILLHITSLPSPYGIGDLGPGAYRFADFLAQSKQRFWQILPINPIDPVYGNSPYHSISAFASNLYLISPELMVQEGLLFKEDLEPIPAFSPDTVHYQEAITYKVRLFHKAYGRFKTSALSGYEEFVAHNAHWLDDFSLFQSLKEHFNYKGWIEWPAEIRDRQPEALQTIRKTLHDRIERECFLHYVFHKQWSALKNYCNQQGIDIFGDMPIYVDHDSVDVWKNPEMFQLDQAKRPSFVAGVPPDYFSESGQLWGNPLYRWDVLKEHRYEWWIQRMEHNLALFDFVRIDHFRGLVAYWEVPADKTTAIEGKWVEVPAEDFFSVLLDHFPKSSIIAEDLGIITPGVRALMDQFQFPGMKVLLFAFDDELGANPYLPHNHVENCVVYTGTHDNNTVKGWFDGEASQQAKANLFRYLGHELSSENIHWELIRLAMMSVAKMVIFPMQDVLGLGENDRMNRPSVAQGNWQWRLLPEHLTPELQEKIRDMTRMYGRSG
jgi:4-alpha-glucanotransferase